MKKSLVTIALLIISLSAWSCWRRPVDQMKIMTDIDLTKYPDTIEYLFIDKIDQTGFRLHLNKEQNDYFSEQLNKITGNNCIASARVGNGCAFESKKGYSVGVTKIGEGLYDIQTN